MSAKDLELLQLPTKPLLFSLDYRGTDYESNRRIQADGQMGHDANRCKHCDCLTIGSKWHFAKKTGPETWEILDEMFMTEIVHVLTHESLHHIFASWTDFNIFSDFAPIRDGLGTKMDYRLDGAFNPFPIFVSSFSVDDVFTETVWATSSPVVFDFAKFLWCRYDFSCGFPREVSGTETPISDGGESFS